MSILRALSVLRKGNKMENKMDNEMNELYKQIKETSELIKLAIKIQTDWSDETDVNEYGRAR